MASGLNKDGGINFERKRNFSKKKEPEMFSRKPEDKIEEEIKESDEEEPKLSAEEIAKNERLNAKLRKAKGIQAGGFALNTSTVVGVLFYLDSLLVDPNTLETLNNVNDVFGLDINFEQMIMIIQEKKAQVVGMCISTQTMIMQYKSTIQKMRDDGEESFYKTLNQQLEDIGV